MTNLELITESLQDLGEVGQGENISAEDAAFGLSKLNEILNSLSNDRLNIAEIGVFSSLLAASVGSYTLGPTGTLALAIRPVLIQSASITISGLSKSLELISAAAYNEIDEQNLTGQLPLKLWPNATMPNMTLRFWPIPSATPLFSAYYWGIIGGGATSLIASLDVPPGYLRALRTILAIEMAPGYGREPSQALLASRQDAYAILRSRNLLDTQNALKMANAPNRGEPQTAPAQQG